MIRTLVVAFIAILTLSSCGNPTPPPTKGGFHPTIFKISKRDTSKIQYRQLDTVNAIREASGLSPLKLSAQLNAAAKTHSIDMAKQQRPWHFGSDGSSPLDRVARTGYPGMMLGENISETYENDTQTLQVWMKDPAARASILDPKAKFLGFAWFQESNGKIWWTQLTGS
ncbi:MAG: CAP domain-containing protein [Rhodobacterales bacterium]